MKVKLKGENVVRKCWGVNFLNRSALVEIMCEHERRPYVRLRFPILWMQDSNGEQLTSWDIIRFPRRGKLVEEPVIATVAGLSFPGWYRERPIRNRCFEIVGHIDDAWAWLRRKDRIKANVWDGGKK